MWRGGRKEVNKRYRNKNEEKIKAYRKEVYWNNKDKEREYQRKWQKENPEKYREKMKRDSKRRLSTPKGRINNTIHSNIYAALKGKKEGRGWESLVGYTLKDLMKHLESQFEDWMNWDNYGKHRIGGKKTWEIDHIIPRSKFNYKTAEDPGFKRCWSLGNLQPLNSLENILKGNKIL